MYNILNFSVCMQEKLSYSDDSFKIVYTIEGIFALILLFTLIMLSSALFFFRSQSKNQRIAAKFGRYQRNIFTLTQTFLYNLYVQFCFGISVFILVCWSSWNPSQESIFNFTLLYFIILLDFVPGFVIPFLILLILPNKLPQLFEENIISDVNIQVFYNRSPEIIPYRDIHSKSYIGLQENNIHVLKVKPYENIV